MTRAATAFLPGKGSTASIKPLYSCYLARYNRDTVMGGLEHEIGSCCATICNTAHKSGRQPTEMEGDVTVPAFRHPVIFPRLADFACIAWW